MSRPPQRIELRADDGTLYTGLVLVKNNIVVAALMLDAGRPTRASSRDLRPMFEPNPYFYGEGDESR